MSNVVVPSNGILKQHPFPSNVPKADNAEFVRWNTLQQLVERLLSGIARRYSLQYADIQDLRQAALEQGAELIPAYDPDEGSLEAFLSARIRFGMLDELDNIHCGGITGDYSGDAIEDLSAVVGEDDEPATDEPGAPAAPVVTLLETIPDEEQPTAEHLQLTDEVLAALESLNLKERNLLIRYFGLYGQSQMTLRQLAGYYRQPPSRIYRRILDALETIKFVVDSTTLTTTGTTTRNKEPKTDE